MPHYKLPKGAKLTSKWVEVSSEAIPTGQAFDEITKVTYEATYSYADGCVVFSAVAQTVEVYYKGKRHYRKSFYGETSHSDAEREGSDAVNKLFSRIWKGEFATR